MAVLPSAETDTEVPCEAFPTAPVATNFGPCCENCAVNVTVTEDVPRTPSLVAVIVAVPTATPVATPVELFTVATLELLVDHVTVRPVSVLPPASFRVAANSCVAPTAIEAVAGATVTVATGTNVTVSVAVPVFPSLVAVMVTVPAATAVAKPVELFTVATLAVLVDQVTVRPVRMLPLESFGVAVNCCVAPTAIEAVAGATATVATGTNVTVSVAVPVFPSLVAVMVAVPTATAVATPVALFTVAMLTLLVDQVTVRPVSMLPLESFGVAVNCCVPPMAIEAVAGATVTDATGAGPAVTPSVTVTFCGEFVTPLALAATATVALYVPSASVPSVGVSVSVAVAVVVFRDADSHPAG
jgi:hypothetical protein